MEGDRADWKRFLSGLSREIAQEVASDVVIEVSRELALELRRQLYEGHYRRLRSLDRMSEKLVYLHLVDHQPQSFMGIRRTLNISKKTLVRVMRELRKRGFVVQDSWFLFWITEL